MSEIDGNTDSGCISSIRILRTVLRSMEGYIYAEGQPSTGPLVQI
jgi:hypothetical protein